MIEVTKLCSKRFRVIFVSLLFYCLQFCSGSGSFDYALVNLN